MGVRRGGIMGFKYGLSYDLAVLIRELLPELEID